MNLPLFLLRGHVTSSHTLSLLFHFPPTAGSLFNTSLSLFHTERACGLLSLSGKSELPEDLPEDAPMEYSCRRHFERAEVSTNKSILFSFLLIAHYRSSWHWTAKPGSPQCHLPTQLKDVSVSTIPGALSALEALCDYALYKSTFTFTVTHVFRFSFLMAAISFQRSTYFEIWDFRLL